MSEQSAEYTAKQGVTANPFNAIPSKVTKMAFMIVLTMMISTSARAEWTAIDGNNQVRLYADFATIRIKGTRVKVWSLSDFTTIQSDIVESYLSSKNQVEFDCSEEQYALRAYVLYSGNMGSGEVVYSYAVPLPDQMLKPIIPNSIIDTELKTVCGRLNQRK
ncbi:MAG: surface-adhesin E family protein [Methylococcales bacterium]